VDQGFHGFGTYAARSEIIEQKMIIELDLRDSD
jgi:hypothetical protein